MPVSVKIGGTWKTATAVFNKVGGAWKTASDMPVKIGGTWKTGILTQSSFESIATVTLGSSSSTITFSSIPGTYKHLQIRGMTRDTVAGTLRSLKMIFNNDTTTQYSSHSLIGDGASATAGSTTMQPFMVTGYSTASNLTSGIYATSIIDIIDYASTTKNKTVRALNGYNSNGGGSVYLASSAWYGGPTSAVTDIQFSTAGTAFAAGSTFALYGIKGA